MITKWVIQQDWQKLLRWLLKNCNSTQSNELNGRSQGGRFLLENHKLTKHAVIDVGSTKVDPTFSK